ncbi:hypothetical protein DSM14862_00857 [Sulfitobacter indolifex]|nr:hypothetical protein DSM14862_00857 [Sulfitobacter indolifex]
MKRHWKADLTLMIGYSSVAVLLISLAFYA